jgi:hypothetical protein
VALEYRLTLAGDTAVPDVVERALPEHAGTGESGFVLYEDRGFLLTVTSGRDGYFDAESDGDEYWEWEPASYVNVEFRLDKDHIADATRNMLDVVARVLATGAEDAALVLDGNALLLTRTDGAVRKHRSDTWWDDATNAIIPVG